MRAEENGQLPIERSPIFSVEGFPITFTILTVRQGFHEQTGKRSFMYIPPGQYARIDLGKWDKEEELPDDVMGDIYTSLSRKLDAKRVYLTDEDDQPLVAMGDMHRFVQFPTNPLERTFYVSINKPTVDDIEGLFPTGDETAWGFPDRRLVGAEFAFDELPME